MFRIIYLALVAVALAVPHPNHNPTAAEPCDPSTCVLPDCRCASTSPPSNLEITQIPQFVFLTFDDAVEELNYEMYSSLFYNRTNPDGCPITATFYVSHEYTDYTKVHDLYIHNHEIALHSISHQALTDYWLNITIEQLHQEFGDQITLISHFANMPEEAILGMRLPFLELSGDNSFQVGKEIGLLYDCSWSTQTFRDPGLWPYTLDYHSIQDCSIGVCPTGSIPGFWVAPMIEWIDEENIVCSMADACVNIPDNSPDLLQWFIDNFNIQYNGNRAPFGFYIHQSYLLNEVHLEAYRQFVDYLQTLNDVYLVGPAQAINWIKNPVPVGDPAWPACVQVEDSGCAVTTCPLQWGEEMRYLMICGTCPEVYPWLGNPLGVNQNQG